MVNIDLAAKYDGVGEEISVKYATKQELAGAGNFDENGNYPNLTVGNATEAVHATDADEANYANTAGTADTAGYATTAGSDEDGNNIKSTYATKTDVEVKANQADLTNVINGTTPVAKSTNSDHATSADTATSAESATDAVNAQLAVKATQDAAGNNIQSTYATKTELDAVDENASRFIENGSYPDLVAGTSNFALQADQAAYASSTASAEFAEVAFHADSADSATKATQDGQGRNIASTYALKSEVGAKKYLHLVNMSTTSQDSEYKFLGIAKIINNSSAAFTTTTLQQFLDGKAVEARGTFAIYKQPLDYMYEAFSIEGEGDSFTVYGGLRDIGEPRYSPSGSYIDGKATIKYSRIDSSRFRDDVTEL